MTGKKHKMERNINSKKEKRGIIVLIKNKYIH